MAEAKLAQCPRCRAATLVAERQGYRIAIDIAPVDALGYGNAVASGVGLWWAENTPGRPSRVLGRRSATQNPSWGPNGAQTGSQRLHAEHSCGASARDQVIINVQAPSGGTVCDQWRATGWTPSRKCPRQMGQTQIKSCHQCEPPPFARPLLPGNLNVETGVSQEGPSDQIREIGGPDGPGADGPGGHRTPGRQEPVNRESRVCPTLVDGRPVGRGDAAAPLDPRAQDGQPAHRGPRQPQHPRQQAQQSAGGHPVRVEHEPRRPGVAVGQRNPPPEIGAIRGNSQAESSRIQAGDVGFGGGGSSSQGGIPGGPTRKGPSQGDSEIRAPHPLKRNVGQVPHLQSRPARCSTCNRVVKPGEVASEIRWGTYVWACHEECP